jgi:hypothetical protein
MTRSLHITRIIKLLIIMLVTAVFPIEANATLRHTYQGNDFDEFSVPSSYTTSMSISGYFTPPAPLLPSHLYEFRSKPPGFTYSFTDGIRVFDLCHDFFVETDGKGEILHWNLVLSARSLNVSMASWNDGVSAEDMSRYYDCNPWSCFTDCGRVSRPGVWTAAASPVPEPTTLILLGTGLAGLVGFRTRKKKQN